MEDPIGVSYLIRQGLGTAPTHKMKDPGIMDAIYVHPNHPLKLQPIHVLQ